MNYLNKFQQFSQIKLNPVIIKQIPEMLSYQMFQISCTHHLKMETATYLLASKLARSTTKQFICDICDMLLVFVMFAPSFSGD